MSVTIDFLSQETYTSSTIQRDNLYFCNKQQQEKNMKTLGKLSFCCQRKRLDNIKPEYSEAKAIRQQVRSQQCIVRMLMWSILVLKLMIVNCLDDCDHSHKVDLNVFI